MSDKAHDISLEQAKELVSLLEEGKQQQANQLLEDVYNRSNDKLFTSVGQLTRDLHEALQDFQLDPRIVQMTEDIFLTRKTVYSTSFKKQKTPLIGQWTR